ncbi:MAG: hypothetical protein LQ342_005850 [Letrouitia transgressa]|nr:MAG: hypothetical protein LQ342_005850 [Letrouitia transgressa]
MSQINGPPPPVPRSVLRRIALLTAIITLSNLAASIQKGSRVFLFQQTQCFNYYQIHDPSKIDWNEMIDEALCKGDGVQHPLSYTVGIDSLLSTLPAIIVMATYQKLLHVIGLRRLCVVKDGKFSGEDPGLLLASSDILDNGAEDSPEQPMLSSEAPKKDLSISRIILFSWSESFHALINIFRTPQPTLTVLSIFLFYGLAARAEVLLPQYTSLTLRWPLATVDLAIALKSLVSACILFVLPTFRKTYLEPRFTTARIDLLITQASLLASIAGMVGLALAPQGAVAFFILSLCVYTGGVGLPDSLTAYGTVTLPQGEKISEYYLRTNLIITIAGMTAAPLWSLMFGTVLSSEYLSLGAPLELCATVFGIALGCTTLLKRWSVGTTGEERF